MVGGRVGPWSAGILDGHDVRREADSAGEIKT